MCTKVYSLQSELPHSKAATRETFLHREGQDAMNHTNGNNDKQFWTTFPRGHSWCCIRLYTQKVREIKRKLEREVKFLKVLTKFLPIPTSVRCEGRGCETQYEPSISTLVEVYLIEQFLFKSLCVRHFRASLHYIKPNRLQSWYFQICSHLMHQS